LPKARAPVTREIRREIRRPLTRPAGTLSSSDGERAGVRGTRPRPGATGLRPKAVARRLNVFASPPNAGTPRPNAIPSHCRCHLV
jgi:hypothetical protein